MLRINRFSFLTIFLIVAMSAGLMNVRPALADDSAPPTPPAEEHSTEEPVEATETPPASETSEPATDEDQTVVILLAEAPENTEIVVLNETGEPIPLATQEAADIAQSASPIWCPASAVPPIIPGTQGCTTEFTSIGDLLANMNAEDTAEWAADYAQSGTIYLAATVNQATTISSALAITNQTYSNIFNNLSSYDLTLQGGWDSLTGAITGQTVFTGSDVFLQIGDSQTPWLGSVSVNNITLFDALATASASLEVHSAATVNLTNVTVGGSGAGQDGVNISAFDVNLTNVRVEWAEGNGITINAAGSGGTVTLNNVVASNNGRIEDGNRLGSGVFVHGNNTLIIVEGGTFANNARFGIEALGSVSDTIPLAQAWTDQDDYFPGSVVTISGGNNSLNGVMLGFIPGETVMVYVVGPNGYTATCEGIANEFGQWSCQITLWDSELAVGDYYYVAIGLTSGVSVTNGFTDARTVNSATISGSNPRAPGSTVSITVNVTTTNPGGSTWAATGYRVSTTPPGTITCVNHADATGAGTYNRTFNITMPNTPGTYNLYIYAYSNDTCTMGQSNLLTMTGVLVVADTTPPVLSLPGNMTLEATGPSGRTVTFTATANDAVDGSRPVTCTPASGSTFPIGTTTVNCSASDLSGNTASGSFTITIQDTTPPALTLPGNMTVEAEDASGAVVSFSATATDIVDGSRPVSCSPASGNTFPLGITTVHCSASDTRGNTANGSFTVTVQDTLAPTLVLPADMIEEATSPAGAEVHFSATATDLVDGDLPVSCSPASGDTFPLGTTTVDCSASDGEGNTASGSFEVTVRDTTPPSIASPADIHVITSNPAGTTVDYVTPTANDLVDGPIDVSCSPVSGSLFPVGTTPVTCTAASDSAGNTASPVTFNVIVTYVPPPPPPPGPTPSPLPAPAPGNANGSGVNGFIPVTGTAYLFDIECPPSNFKKEFPTFYLTFVNLCGGYKGTVEFLGAANLPGPLANGETFLNGFSVGVVKNDVVVPLPAAAQITIEFIVPTSDLGKDLAILFWDGSKWVEVEGSALNGNLFTATVNATGFYILAAK